VISPTWNPLPDNKHNTHKRQTSVPPPEFKLAIPEGKRPLGRLRRRGEDNINMVLQKVGFWGMDWIGLARDTDR
jgi:hypothetical protein